MPVNNNITHFFRFLYISIFIFSGLLVLTSIKADMFDITEVLKIVDYFMLFVQEIIRVLGEISFYIVRAILLAKSPLILIGDPNLSTLNFSGMSSSLSNLLNPQNNFFPHSAISIEDPQVLIDDLSHFFGATAIMILVPIAFLSGIGFLREGDTKLAIYSFLGFQLIIIIAIFTKNILISTIIDSSNIFSMLFSPLFTLGFLLYLLLETAFQTSYVLNIIQPMIEREKRIQEHLKRIRTFVPKSEEEGGKEQSIQSIQSNKFGLLASSYLREMVERRVFRKGETVRDAKSMMRLQSYLASLNQSDSQTDMKLAAKTAQPNISALLKHFVPAMILRIIAVVLISYYIMAPEGILKLFVSASFPALLNSLELGQPEFRTIAILNVALLVILFSAILHYLTSGRTGKVLVRVVQQIDTLVDFQRASRATSADKEINKEVEDISEQLSEEKEKTS